MKPLFVFLSVIVLICFCGLSQEVSAQENQTQESQPEDTQEQPAADESAADGSATKPTTTYIFPQPLESLYANDIQHYLRGDEIKQMVAADDTFLVLLRENMTGQSKGVMIFIPDWSEPATSAKGINYLRKEMNDYGWVTMSMAVSGPVVNEQYFPDYNRKPTPPSSDEAGSTTETTSPASSNENNEAVNSENTEEAAGNTADNSNAIPTSQLATIDTTNAFNEASVTTYKQQLLLRIQSVMNEAQNYPGYFVVVAQGASGAWLTSLYATEALEPPQALILLSATVENTTLNRQFAQDIGRTEMPILDIYQTNDRSWLLSSLKLRRQYAKKFFKVHYRQRELFGDTSYTAQYERLHKTIYGWLTSLGI
ncbi:DUF3530 family protein [Flocculibacter collagenilyticus]|uniref:DUF3530 family protein n=1 Tax=Flocculibacter collagenilyticus TaxID=2744479 RepID=UPI0018F449CE|nr:DUF3530 family protein [Flocculibacter collagenilyticus]